MAENIVIDEPTLTRLKNKYQALLDDIDLRMTNYTWGTNPDSQISLGDAFPLRLGGAGFTEAVNLAKDLEKVRTNLTGRIDTTYTNATNLRWGLQYLLDDSSAVEHLNTLTAAEFESFIPTSTSSATGGNNPPAGGS